MASKIKFCGKPTHGDYFCRGLRGHASGKHTCSCIPLLLQPKPARRRPTDTERLDCVLKRLRGWESSTGMAIGMTTRREVDKVLREEARRG